MPLGSPMSCRTPQFWISQSLLHSIVERHDSPTKFVGMRIHGLSCPDHPGTLDIDKASRRLLALPEPVSNHGPVVSEVFPRDFLVVDLVECEVVLRAPSVTHVVVSEFGPLLAGPRCSFCSEIPVLLSSAPVSVLYLILRPLSRPGYCGYYGSSSDYLAKNRSQSPSPATSVCRMDSASHLLLRLLSSSEW